MPLRLKIFYTITSLMLFLIALFGFDLLYPIDEQIFYKLTGIDLGLNPSTCGMIIFSAVGLLFVVVSGYVVDKRSYSRKI